MQATLEHTTDCTTESIELQVPASYQDRYEIIRQLGTAWADYKARADAAHSREARDNWLESADAIWGRMEARAVQLFDLTDGERADFNAMVGFSFDPATSVERIIQARDSADYNKTINAVLWGGY